MNDQNNKQDENKLNDSKQDNRNEAVLAIADLEAPNADEIKGSSAVVSLGKLGRVE
ncbi:MAG: hypothetical protein M3X11_01235 [Acidobacteriota bacterium]|nr:hypothetical protein [Acidobacteriota bacterium]